MNLSQAVSGRARNVNVTRDQSFLPQETGKQGTHTSALPWKPAIFQRVRAALRGARHHVMEALVRLSGPDGQCWVSMATLAREARVDIKTARKHVHALVQVGGFLRADSMTWAQLCANRRAAARPVPRTDNDRNAPYLFTVLDGVGRRASELPEGERLQRFVTRFGRPPRRAQVDRRPVTLEPQTRDLVTREGYQIWQGRGLPNLVADSSDDPSDQEMSVHAPQSGACFEQHTFLVSASKGEGELWQGAWNEVQDAYRKHYFRVYQGTPKSPRGLKPDDPREAGEYLTEKAQGLAVRLNVPQEAAVKMLADRALGIWLDRKGSGGFLERESHPLRALCEEFPARVNEAFKALVREHFSSSIPKAPEKLEKTEKPAVSWEEIDAARRKAKQEFDKNFGAPSRLISRPNLQPTPEKPADVSHAEIRVDASSTPNEPQKAENKGNDAASDEPVTMPERASAPRPGLPRIVEALPALPRPESARSGPRWGEAGHRAVKMRRTWAMNSTEQATEPEETIETLEPHPRE
jgi:Helix-turn-helix domain